MKLHHRPIIRALIFLLLVGPLQAQQMFACEMMNATFLDNCCCVNHDNGNDDAITVEKAPCCEESTELTLNFQADETTNIIKSVEIRSDVDPPLAVIFAVEELVEPVRVIISNNQYSNPPYYQCEPSSNRSFLDLENL